MKNKPLDLPRHPSLNQETAPCVVFIHGLSGSPRSTWKGMISCFDSDHAFVNHTLDCYTFPTTLIRLPFGAPLPGLRGIAEGLRTFLDEQHGQRESISIVAHSLGGLIARQYIVSEMRAGRTLRVDRLALIAVPNNGSSLASVGQLVSFPHRQLKRLAQDDEALRSLNIDWEQLKVEETLPVRYIVGGCDRVVPHESAIMAVDRDNKSLIIDSDHRSIIRPVDQEDIRYRTIRRFIVSSSYGPPSTGGDNLPAIIRRTADPLFEAYTCSDEPYYVPRAVDRLIGEALGNGHVWLTGPSGVGKTASLRRAVLQSGWQLHHINLAGYEIDSPTGLFRALAHELAAIACIDRRLDSDSDFGECCKYLKEVLREFSNDLTIANVVEELPVATDSLGDFADLVGIFLDSLATDGTLYARVVFAFSSINPLRGVKPKTREKVQLIGISSWSDIESMQLVEMLSAALRPHLSVDDFKLIVESANGSPRFIKQLFRMWRNGTAGNRNLAELLLQIESEFR